MLDLDYNFLNILNFIWNTNSHLPGFMECILTMVKKVKSMLVLLQIILFGE